MWNLTYRTVVSCRKMLHAEQHKIRSEYELKFRELERERLQVQDKRAQVRVLRIDQYEWMVFKWWCVCAETPAGVLLL